MYVLKQISSFWGKKTPWTYPWVREWGLGKKHILFSYSSSLHLAFIHGRLSWQVDLQSNSTQLLLCPPNALLITHKTGVTEYVSIASDNVGCGSNMKLFPGLESAGRELSKFLSIIPKHTAFISTLLHYTPGSTLSLYIYSVTNNSHFSNVLLNFNQSILISKLLTY